MLRTIPLALCLALCGCNDAKKDSTPLVTPAIAKPSDPPAPPPSPPKKDAPADAKWGTISGRVIWGDDKLPPPAFLNLNNHADTAVCQKKGPVPDETWIVNPKNKGFKNVFVWLEPAEKGGKLPIHPSLEKPPVDKVEIDQPDCAFVPHAVAMREGQILVAKNSSSIAHNFKYAGHPELNPGGNSIVAPGGPREIENLKADKYPIVVECSLHPWMRGWIRVYNHPYFAITDVDGAFTIKNAPVGDFRMKVWQAAGGWLGGAEGKNGSPITIKSGENKLDDLAYPPPK